MSVVSLKSDYIFKANSVYSNLLEVEEQFEKQAYVLSYVKCILLREEELEDFYINGISVSVYQTSNGYELYYEGKTLDIEVYNKQIIDFKLT